MARSSKSGAKAERDALREEMLGLGCTYDLTAQEMRHRWGFRPREAYRHALGWSQDQAALRYTEAVGRMAADRGPHAPMIGTRIGEYERWPHGGRRPSTYVLTVLATTYATTVDRLLDYDDYRNLPDQDRTVLSALINNEHDPAAQPPVEHRPEPQKLAPVRSGRTSGPSPGPVAAAAPAAAQAAPGDVVLAVSVGLHPNWVSAATALNPAAALVAAGLETAPGSGSGARRRRRDQLLDQGIGPLPTEEAVFMAAADQSAEFGEWAGATNVGQTTLEQIEEDVRRIARTYLNGTPVPLMLDAIRLRNRAFTLLEGRQHPIQSRQLYISAGRVCGLLAWMSSDVGRNREAETQARTGWLCAELADHDGLRAWIRATQSKLAYWDGQITDSARLAEAGLRHPATDSARILLAGLAARAWARLGRPDAAQAALGQADDERAAKSTTDEVGGLYGLSEAQQHYLAGSTYLYLGDLPQALTAAGEAVRKFETGPPGERFYGAEALALIDAATAHIRDDDLEGAADKLASVLKLPRQQRLETCTQRLADMHRTLSHTRYARSPLATDLRGQIDDFRASAISHYLSR